MENKNIFVYYENEYDYAYKTIDEEHIQSLSKVREYFGDFDRHLNESDELVIYKLVPHVIIKKNVDYNLKKI